MPDRIPLRPNEPKPRYRVGSKIKLNVYDGDRPMCQCHDAQDSARIVGALNLLPEMYAALQKALALFDDDHALSRFDWGKSALRAEDIRELNELPGILRAALEVAHA